MYDLAPERTGRRGRPAKHGNGFALKQILLFPRKRSVIIIQVSAGFSQRSLRPGSSCLCHGYWKRKRHKTSIFQHNLFRRSEGLLYGGGTLIFWPDRSWSSKLYPLLLYAFRWKIEIGYYEQKTFWSFCDYMVRSRKGIEMLVNLINISYCAMKILPYQDKYFSKYRTKSVQEFRFELSQEIRKQIFFATFVKISKHI